MKLSSPTTDLVAKIALKWIEKRPFSEEGKARRKARREQRRAERKARREGVELTSEGIEYEVEAEDTGMTKEVLMMLIRHGLTLAGGAGFMTESEVAQLSAALATVIGLAWSFLRKWKRQKAAQ